MAQYIMKFWQPFIMALSLAMTAGMFYQKVNLIESQLKKYEKNFETLSEHVFIINSPLTKDAARRIELLEKDRESWTEIRINIARMNEKIASMEESLKIINHKLK